jgi:hypothetical protein
VLLAFFYKGGTIPAGVSILFAAEHLAYFGEARGENL